MNCDPPEGVVTKKGGKKKNNPDAEKLKKIEGKLHVSSGEAILQFQYKHDFQRPPKPSSYFTILQFLHSELKAISLLSCHEVAL